MGRRRRSDDPATSGLLLVDKPAGVTSHDVVARVRRILAIARVGHSGTLDPMATGLMLVGCGWATRLLRFGDDLPKTYEAEVTLGVETDTWDADGEVLARCDVTLDAGAVETALAAFVGELDQIPPMHSAIKVGGEKLYEKVRRGEVVEREPRRVTVERIEVLPAVLPRVRFSVTCSAGTYVRSLAHDLGAGLGTGAHLSALRRTRIGRHRVQDAATLDELERDGVSLLAPPLAVVSHLPRVEVDEAAAAGIATGRRIPVPGAGRVAVVAADTGCLVAVYEGGRAAVTAPPPHTGADT